MNRKFVIVDPSIRDSAGHYLEYAQAAGEAARAEGFEVVLVSNRDLDAQTAPPCFHRVIPHFSYDFWGRRSAKPKAPRKAKAAVRSTEILRSPGVRARIYLSLLWKSVRYRQEVDKRSVVEWSKLRLAALAIAYLMQSLARSFVLLLWALIPFRSYFRGVIEALRHLGRSFLAPLRFLRRNYQNFRRQLVAMDYKKTLAEEMNQMEQALSLSAGDLVFWPTVSTTELLALGRMLGLNGNKGVSWHLLFRRDLFAFDPRTHTSSAIDSRLEGAFIDFKRAVPADVPVSFYTDTWELTAQYNSMKLYPFRTLPIPHTQAAQARTAKVSSANEIKVTYLGDARNEKRYHWLAELALDYCRDPQADPRVRFVLQSNTTSPEPEPDILLAQWALRTHAARLSRRVEIVQRALSSAEYQDLLLKADAAALVYDPDNYHARSSGVLIEALTAGKPVLLSSASWLARQVQDYNELYQKKLLENVRQISVWENSEPLFFRVGGLERSLFAKLPTPEGCTHLALQLQADQGLRRLELRLVELDEQQREVGTARVRLYETHPQKFSILDIVKLRPQTRHLELWVNHPRSSYFELVGLRCQFLDLAQSDWPLSAGAVLVHGRDGYREAFDELVKHFAHYQATARDLAESLASVHNARNLIQGLLAGTASPGLGSTAESPLLSETQPWHENNLA